MVIDTSALFAIAANEPEREAFIEIIEADGAGLCSAVTYVESGMGLTGRSKPRARTRIDELLHIFGIEIVPISQALTDAAVDAFDRFGKGRHRARLNLADCFS